MKSVSSFSSIDCAALQIKVLKVLKAGLKWDVFKLKLLDLGFFCWEWKNSFRTKIFFAKDIEFKVLQYV